MPNPIDWSTKESTLRGQFEALTPALEKWGSEVDENILAILAEASFDSHGLQMLPRHRVKKAGSFISKSLYRSKSAQYTDPITDIKDKVATRLVVLTVDQVTQVAKMLNCHSSWQIEIDREISIGTELGPTAFGYQSVHLLAQPTETARRESGILLNTVVCEIQVRTLLQHAYAEVSHGTVYKGSYKHEPTIQRKLARSMALMEAVDEYFQMMFSAINSNELASSAFSKEMEVRFAQLWPDFDSRNVDSELFSFLFDTIYDPRVFDSQKLDAFVLQNKAPLERVIQRNKYHIAHQPIILFVAYLLKNRPKMLNERWELDKSILRDLGREMGVSIAEFD